MKDITKIISGPSGETTNNKRIHQLEVHLHDQPKITLFKQLPNDELSWLAAVLRDTTESPD